MILRPEGVLILAKNPQVARRLLFFGWYVLFNLSPLFSENCCSL
jgi:hypothetical protein